MVFGHQSGGATGGLIWEKDFGSTAPPSRRACVWQSDVDRANAGTGQTMTTTGGQVWAAARRMAEFLEASQDELQLRRPGAACVGRVGSQVLHAKTF